MTKLVVISVDGASDYILDDLLKRNILPENGAFKTMSKKGIHAKALIPVNISATAVSHTALYTGTSPGKNGIVGNQFHVIGDQLSEQRGTSGFDAQVLSESIWSAALRQGKSVVNINTIGVNSKTFSNDNSKIVTYGKRIANSSVETLVAIGGPKDTYSNGKFENIRRLSSKGSLNYQFLDGEKIPLIAFAIDDDFDGKTSYSGILLDFDEDFSNGYAGILKENKWTEIQLKKGNINVSSWSYLMNFDPFASSTLYLGPIGYNEITPETFKSLIDSQVGNWPDEQDNRKLSQGLISEEMWLDQSERQAIHYKKQISKAIETENWDLISGYFTLIDDVQHRFLLTDERQLDFGMEDGLRRERYRKYVEWAYQTIDGFLMEIIEKAPKNVNFIVISDHGMAPIHSVFLVNNYLTEIGFKTNGKGLQAKALNTGPAAHIYLNVEGKYFDGIVPMDSLVNSVDQIVNAFKSLKDPMDGKPIFDVVLKSNQLKRWGLENKERSGDVFLNAKPGWSLSSRGGDNLPTIIPSSFQKDAYQHLSPEIQEFLESGFMNEIGLGVHGNLGSKREMHAVLYGLGPNIPNKKLGKVSALDITPTLAELLGIAPPKDAKGKPAFKRLRLKKIK